MANARTNIVRQDVALGDAKISVEIQAIFHSLNREKGITVILVTHEPDIAAYASRTILYRDGRILKDERIETPREASAELRLLT